MWSAETTNWKIHGLVGLSARQNTAPAAACCWNRRISCGLTDKIYLLLTVTPGNGQNPPGQNPPIGHFYDKITAQIIFIKELYKPSL